MQLINSISDINQLDLADGLKESLIEYGFDLESLLNTTPERTAEVLGIELDVAKIIHAAAMKKKWIRIFVQLIFPSEIHRQLILSPLLHLTSQDLKIMQSRNSSK